MEGGAQAILSDLFQFSSDNRGQHSGFGMFALNLSLPTELMTLGFAA
jgi:hypothetical protein